MVHGPALPHLADPLMCGHQFPCSGLGWSWCYYFITGGNDIEPRRYWSLIDDRAANDPLVFTITEKALTSTFTFKTLLRHYAKQVPKHGK